MTLSSLQSWECISLSSPDDISFKSSFPDVNLRIDFIPGNIVKCSVLNNNDKSFDGGKSRCEANPIYYKYNTLYIYTYVDKGPLFAGCQLVATTVCWDASCSLKVLTLVSSTGILSSCLHKRVWRSHPHPLPRRLKITARFWIAKLTIWSLYGTLW